VDDLLAGYGAGTLDPARHALVASHLLLKPENRRFVRTLEDSVAARLCETEARPLSRRDARLAAIFGVEEAPVSRAASAAGSETADLVLPEPLRRFMGVDLADVPWTFVMPGVRECKFSEFARGSASLLHVRAGRRLPQHTHEGSEVTLVLTGAFSDPNGRYARGDIAFADAHVDHSPLVDADSDCICFAVTDGPLTLTSPVGRLVQKLFMRKH
jgi:putative transcriptional regulator